MYSNEKNDMNVRIAVRQKATVNEAVLLSSLGLVVVLSVLVLIGRSMGGM